MKRYVMGFLFSEDRESVVLIKKNRPDWQKGSWNGVGGQIEKGENPLAAFLREFKEETGVELPIPGSKVQAFATMDFGEVMVYVCRAFHDDSLSKVQTTTDEEVRILNISTLRHRPLVEGLSWLIPMALDEVTAIMRIYR